MQVAILTPAADETLYQTMWPDWFARLEAGLAGSGVAAVAHDWTRPLETPVAAVLPMLAWATTSGRGRGWRGWTPSRPRASG